MTEKANKRPSPSELAEGTAEPPQRGGVRCWAAKIEDEEFREFISLCQERKKNGLDFHITKAYRDAKTWYGIRVGRSAFDNHFNKNCKCDYEQAES